MTPFERVHRARRWLVAALLANALLRVVAVSLGVLLVAAILNRLWPATHSTRWLPVAVLAGVASGGMLLWRGRAVRSQSRIALWIEEQQPGLAYALVTAVDSELAGVSLPPALLTAADEADVERLTARAAWRALGRAVLLLAAVALPLLLWVPDALLQGKAPLTAAARDAALVASRLAPLSILVTPPAYSRFVPYRLEEPGSLGALPGSSLTFIGRGNASAVSIDAGPDTLPTVQSGNAWSGTMRMPAAAAVVTLRDRGFRRLVVLEPRRDSVPGLVLRQPLHDTTWQSPPSGRLELEARASDDIGLASGYFEYLLSAGGGESFETTVSTTPRQPFGNARTAVLRATLLLDTLKLVPGSVLSIRAMAFDANDVDGPGRGLSETRTLRVAELSDTSTVDAQPPDPIDETRISQRRLNMKTDTLIRDRRRLSHTQFVDRSADYADLQLGIRARVLEVVALLEDADEEGSYPTDDSRLLRGAADEMMRARWALVAAQPDSAMPHMRRALQALDQVRTAHRYYLRGRRRAELIDIARVRLQGKETGTPADRSSRRPLADERAGIAARVEVAARLHSTSPDAAIDSLTWIRVATLATDPPVAQALKTALEELRKGVSVDSALAPVRLLLVPAGTVLAGPSEWTGGSSP